MKYIKQAYYGMYDYWRYIIGIGIVFIGIFIFSLPHGLAIAVKSLDGSLDNSKLSDTNYLMTAFEPNLNLLFLLLPFAGGLIALFMTSKYLHKLSLTKLTTSRSKIDWKRVFFAFFFWGIVSSSMVLIDYFINPEPYIYNFKWIPFLILCVISIALVPLQTSFEEYLFRGYLMQGLGVLFKNKWLPLIITSAAFGLLHIANPEIDQLGHILLVYYIGTGLFLGIITLMDEGLELALGFHAANNLFTALLITADWTAFQTHSILKDVSEPEKAGLMDTFFPVFVIFPIFIFIFAKKYKWTNWKDKLFGKVDPPIKENYKLIGEDE